MLLPDAKAASLHLSHPTEEEKVTTWKLNYANWGNALSLEEYIQRERYLQTVPLARDGGVTHWILVDKTLEPNNRAVLASCESIWKRALVKHKGTDKVKETITHGIGSVFCNPQYRGKGYASRMLTELSEALRTLQLDPSIPGREECIFSVLWSDIGKKFYAGHGWHPFPSTHLEFPPVALPEGKFETMATSAKKLTKDDLAELCALDEKYVLKALEQASSEKTHVAIIPTHETMQWHHGREDLVTNLLFKSSPSVKGAIAGSPGSRVWAIWTRGYYGKVDDPKASNSLYILRHVIEDESKEKEKETAENLKAVLAVAQDEANTWKCKAVHLWNPGEWVKGLVRGAGIDFKDVDRDEESIASLFWYGEGSGKVDEIDWIANEKFAWC
ncbi:hypothetical protein F5884DRAFT_382934 [Xylogone sp. PMI_703]|nr:hypothetical protein F5884DRAFT_382934 [Xylogone sp. PMI_703]